MNISVVIPTYNEEKKIKGCIKAIIKNRYGDPYEIVVVNDGSTDKTSEKIREMQTEYSTVNIRLVNLRKNRGRAIARELCAKKAKYKDLLFVDSRVRMYPDVMEKLKKINYSPLVGRVVLDEEKYKIDRFFQLCRRKVFSKFMKEESKIHFITPENFDEKPKGTTFLFCTKDLFLTSQYSNKESKVSSDDTKLLYNISLKKPIMRHPDIHGVYASRKRIRDEIHHMFFRGVKFIDYYLKPGKRYFIHLLLFFFSTLFLITGIPLFLILQPKALIFLLLAVITLSLIAAVWISERFKDIPIVIFYGCIIFPTFGVGLLWGTTLKLLKKI